MKLSTKGFALSLGILSGVLVFLLTNFSILRGGTGQRLYILRGFFYGYSVSFVGSLIGFVWVFVSMFIIGWVFAWLYNKLC
jgi:hypothetical protein